MIIRIEKVIYVMPDGDRVGTIVKCVWFREWVWVIGRTVGKIYGWRDFISIDGSYVHGRGIEIRCDGGVDTMLKLITLELYVDTSTFTCKYSSTLFILATPKIVNFIENLS